MSDQPKNYKQRAVAARASAIGIQFAVSVVVGALLGTWLDGFFGTDPWLLLIGFFFGVAAAFIDLIRLSKQFKDRNNEPK